GPVNEITVVDGRDTDPGWVGSGSVTQFNRVSAGPVAHFSGNNLGWQPAATDTGPLTTDDGTYDQTVAAGAPGTPQVPRPGLVPGLGLMSTPGTLATANAGQGLGIARLNAALTLLVPINAGSGNYASLMTITVV